MDIVGDSVIEGILDHVLPGFLSEDRRRIVRFVQGFPGLAVRVGEIQGIDDVVSATDDRLVDAFITGHRASNQETLVRSARLLAVFGMFEKDLLEQIAAVGNFPVESLKETAHDLMDCGIIQQQGKNMMVQPRMFTANLAKRQWERWNKEKWDHVLAGDIHPELKVAAAKQLALLNTEPISKQVVEHVCRYLGPFGGFPRLFEVHAKTPVRLEDLALERATAERKMYLDAEAHAEVLSSLAEIDREVVAEQIERSFDDIGDLRYVVGQVRRHLVWAVEKIAFAHETFETGAWLMLRLGLAENEVWSNNATGQFQELFPVLLSNTAADGKARLAFLDDVANTTDLVQLRMVVEALSSAFRRDHYRIVGVESQGLLPAMEPWYGSPSERKGYLQECATRLADLAIRDDEIGTLARNRLGNELETLVRFGLLDVVEQVVRKVFDKVGYWPEAKNSLDSLLTYGARELSDQTVTRVQALTGTMNPRALRESVLAFTSTAQDFAIIGDMRPEELFRQQVETACELAARLVDNPDLLTELLPTLSHRQLYRTYLLGKAIAETAVDPLPLLEVITQSVRATPASKRSYEYLSGYLVGIVSTHPSDVETFKQTAAQSFDLAPAMPLVTARMGVTDSDVELAIDALRGKTLFPKSLCSWSWGRSMEGVSTASVGLLLGTLIDHSAEGFAQALDLLGMYTFDSREKLDDFQPIVVELANNATKWEVRDSGSVYHFEEVMNQPLNKGRQDAHAKRVALALAKAAADRPWNDELIKPMLPTLLSEFPEIAWSLIGQAVVSDDERLSALEFLLGGFFDKNGPPPAIAHLPEDTLFAWCYANPNRGPAFAAKTLPVITKRTEEDAEWGLSSTIVRLLNEFGEPRDVQEAVYGNISTVVWAGSMTEYFALYESPLTTLLQHPKRPVRRFASKLLRTIRFEIERTEEEDKAREMASRWHV